MKATQKSVLVLILMLLIGFSAKSINRPEGKSFRGFMIDAPRGVETIEYYFRLIDFCREEGLNSIIFRLTDDQGSAYLFTSHPELNMCEGAFSAKELKTIIDYAQKNGIEMIPEIESFGHARYIIQTKRYKSLNDGPAGEDFNALCPVNDSTLSLMNDLYNEVASVFPGQYFHIGCDEVLWGAGKLSEKALETKGKPQIWAEYVNKLNGFIKALGKKTIIWGDVPLYNVPEVLDLLDKDIVIMDWNYWETNRSKIQSLAQMVLSKGFKLMGCPAVNWCAWGPRVGEKQFQNINAYAEVYENISDSDNLGIFLSNWVPKRYIQGSQWDTYTIAAEILKSKGNYHYMDAIPQFVKNHFGVNYDTSWEKIFKTIYSETPEWGCGQEDSLKFFCWHSEKEIRDIVSENRHLTSKFGEISGLMTNCKKGIKKKMHDFDDLLLTIDFIEYNYKRQNDLLSFIHSKETDIKAVDAYLKKVAREDQQMLSRINVAWSTGRRSKPSATDKDFMWSFNLASAYSKHLSETPGEFMKILQGINK
jgi:Glycosyl hydrolase family 20, catalytic domain